MGSMRAANRLCISGEVEVEPQQDHVCCGNVLAAFGLRVPRQSGVCDSIRVLASERALTLPLRAGDPVCIWGQLRAYHRMEGAGNRLHVTAFASLLTPAERIGENRVELCGTLRNDPAPRATPLGREICDLLLSVERAYGRRDTIPAIVWGRCARACAAWRAGDMLSLEGRLQSRAYRKALLDGSTEERVVYEVSAYRAEPI